MPKTNTPSTFSADTIAAHATLAGDGFKWEGKEGPRPPSYARKNLRRWLADQQGGLCPVCGDALRHAQFNHVVSRGPHIRGFIGGNIFAGCALCNLDCALTYGTVDDDGMVKDGGVIPFEHFARPDLIATTIPGPTFLKTY